MSFKCSECGKVYKTIASLKTHKVKAHGRKAPKKHFTKTRNGYKPTKKVEKKISIKGKTMNQIRESLMDNISNLEQDFMDMLTAMGVNFIRQYQIGTKFFDFYIPDKNILLEVDGDFHHSNPAIYKKPQYKVQRQTVRNDHQKNRLAEQAGITLLRFWESDIRDNMPMVMMRLMVALNLQ